MRTIIVTMGTSLVGNAQKAGMEGNLQGYLKQCQQSGRLYEASAETNSLMRLLQEGDKIVFLYSDTDEAKQIVEALQKFYDKEGYTVEARLIPHLNYKESSFKVRGLRSFVAELATAIRREQQTGRTVLINATGGFKAEAAYATLVGVLFKVPVYYIHEMFKDIIELPAIPIEWDYSLIDTYRSFFEWIAADARTSHEVDARIKSLPPSERERIYLLLNEEDDYTLLSPVGEALYQRYLEIFYGGSKNTLYMHPKAIRALESAEPSVQQKLKDRLASLANPELRRGNAKSLHNSDCFSYPSGGVSERIIFYTEKEGNNEAVYVCEIFSEHDDYERALKGVRSQDYRGGKFERRDF
ncbi:MAG: putative CRISPR-associated protein [Fimbriimonadales bacterium]